MKRIYFYIIAAVATLSLTMCAKGELPSTSDETISPDNIVTIGIGLADTKVAVAQGENKLTLSWQENDSIRVQGQTTEIYHIVPGFSDHYAQFTGQYAGEGNKSLWYPGKYASAAEIGARSYANQVQDGNGSTAHLEFNALAENLTSITNVDLTASKAKVNQAVKFVVKLPAGVTTVSALVLQAPSNLFYTTNAGSEMTDKIVLTLQNVDVSASGQILTAYMMASWQEMDIPSGTAFTVKVITPTTSEACCYSLVATTNKAYKWVGGNTFTFDMSSKELVHTIKGTGIEGDPYLLYDVYDLTLMNGLLVKGQKTYFKLMADVDMSSVTEWNPANQTSPYNTGIDFDGCNHTISNFTCTKEGVYAGFVGMLYGRIANLTFVDPVISATKAAGVVTGYAGTGSYTGDIENVTIHNASVTQKGNSGYTGILFGTNGVAGKYTNCHVDGTLTMDITSAASSTKVASGGIAGSSIQSTFTDCSFEGTINGARFCGGIVGYERKANSTFTRCSADLTMTVKKVTNANSEYAGGIVGYWAGGTMSDCYAKGSIEIKDQMAGGLAGDIVNSSTITTSWSSVNLTATKCCGGIAGRAANNGWKYDATKTLEISKCIYWGTKIDVAGATTSYGSSGSILGFTTLNNVVSNCWRINDSKFTFVNTGNTLNYPADQPDGCSTWEKGVTPQVGLGTGDTKYLFPYWGKAAEGTATVSSVAKSLGWDENVWDLSGDEPVLK